MKLLIAIIGMLLIGCNSTEMDSTNNKPEKKNHQKENNELVKEEFQNGDLIFHTSRSSQSLAIQIATNSKYSHVGIIYQEGSEFYVYEAIQPVKITKLNDWISRGENGKYVAKRLKNSESVLTKQGIKRMKLIGKKYLGKDYDLKFADYNVLRCCLN
jgi:hypothetical protein